MQLIRPEWPAPANVQAVCTTRAGGVSTGLYSTLNLGTHVGDEAATVQMNRRLLMEAAGLPVQPAWLEQVHGTEVVDVGGQLPDMIEADAGVSHTPGEVCAIMTADCLPVLFASTEGDCVAAAHAGWRGLAAGVLANTVEALDCPNNQLLAWLGPAIGPQAFEVGDEVRAAFLTLDDGAGSCFVAHADRWLADIYALARRQLAQLGVKGVYGGDFCTYSDSERFFSYRRDGVCGRMASLIWLT